MLNETVFFACYCGKLTIKQTYDASYERGDIKLLHVGMSPSFDESKKYKVSGISKEEFVINTVHNCHINDNFIAIQSSNDHNTAIVLSFG